PLAGLELVRIGGNDAHDSENASVDIGDRIAGFDRRPARFTGHRHEARESLRYQIEAALVTQRTITPVSGHGTIDEPGIRPGQYVVAQAQLFQRATTVV